MTKTLKIESHQAFAPSADHSPQVSKLASDRIARAKVAFTTRRVPTDDMKTLVQDVTPRPGDLVLATVKRRRQHPRLELTTGRKASMFIGDEIVVCYGNRYATDQFEAVVPNDLGPCHLVASGGIAACAQSRRRGVRPATEITPIGLIGNAQGKPINLDAYRLSIRSTPAKTAVPCIAVAGSAMNAGKTTSAANLVKGLSLAGLKVGAAKVTGTGSGGDYWRLLDAGAAAVVDFTDAGFASTYMEPLHNLERIVEELTAHLIHEGAEAIVIEIADGLLQHETAALINSPTLRSIVTGYLLAVSDALGAVAGAKVLEEHDLSILGLCGTLTSSPLAAREAVDQTGLPVLTLNELRSAAVAMHLTSSLPGLEQLTQGAR